ncbi:head-tail adaptor [Vibrio phage 1.072.O._10N.286.48.A12]|nr:head-tail adaptor [Vibrio phage 1.004.O._10N.261.54.A2]AUR83570.1 head-tail adaptor [Vibrio phage 1.037.O._10N.261.52.F7]AUR84453.1 head-tail adaptor [Vibrio phage 1.056.O._10N.261.48.C11]AUR84970.1 head-tail adaptor [Vibrio phage 1.066.O._10N.286.46.E8]AUR85101.1 head-tail adaptor [Vibrio phage 1.068.O._10N.261.51.F8]AUR85328.1 head-tail adaptor [Vibrio phage 1.072.O._10N.286.48.A12]AUS01873.1 head-tail adaptor [Vibrio phage 2.044.O._10N.261.51.B8]
MQHKITAGQLTEYVVIKEGFNVPDENGEIGGERKVFDARADVLVRSGGELAQYGTVVTSEVITALMWYDKRAKNSMYIEWDGKVYRIEHVRPDSQKRSMIITAEIERDD